MSKGKVLIAAPVHPVLTEGLKQAGYELLIAESISQEMAPALIKEVEGVITSTRLQLDKSLLDKALELKWIGRMGSGMEVIDLDYARQKGVECFGSPEGNANAVGEHALGMLLSLTKKITASHIEVQEGLWKREENRGLELEGKTIGIIGFGHTGRSFAKKLSGFDMRILAYDKYSMEAMPNHAIKSKLEDIFREADIVSFHVPLQADTIHYFNDLFLGQMQKPFILINTSRGNIVDINTLTNGLREKRLIGTCLDVIEEEPPNKMSMEIKNLFAEIIKMPNVLITPHIAGYSEEALFKMSKILLGHIVKSL